MYQKISRVEEGIFADSEGGHTLHAREAVMEHENMEYQFRIVSFHIS